MVLYATYRQLAVHRTPDGGDGERRRLSRAFWIALALVAALFAYYLLLFLLAVSKALLPDGYGVLEVLRNASGWTLLTVSVLVGLAVGGLRKWVVNEPLEGIAAVMHAVAVKDGRMSAASGPAYAGATALTIAGGGSAGIEGPVVAFGGATASGFGRMLRLTRERQRVLVAAGAGAGIAASFNAPVAGAMFALEVIVGDFALATFSPIVIASVLATVVHRSIEGNNAVFHGVHFSLTNGYELALFVVLGLLGGTVGTLFVRGLEFAERVIPLLLRPLPIVVWPAIGLLGTGLIAMITGRYEIMGSGHEAIALVHDNALGFGALALLAAGKMLATMLTDGSRAMGGIFFPSLFIGAAMGSAFGQFASFLQYFGIPVAPPNSYALIGMGALAAAVAQAPLFGIVMVFELTNDYASIMPLMIACILSSLVARHALRMNKYQRQVARTGIVLDHGRVQNVLFDVTVDTAMTTTVHTVSERCTLGELRHFFEEKQQWTMSVVDQGGRLTRVLSIEDIRPVMFEEGLENVLVAGELGTPDVITVTPNDTLAVALERFSDESFRQLLVVSEQDRRQVVGMLSRRALLQEYQNALERFTG